MIDRIFLNNLQTQSDAVAIVTSQEEVFTYYSANQRVNAWVTYFLQKNIQPGDRVGVLLDDEDLSVFILLALSRMNATFVPFDTDIPTEQIKSAINILDLKKFIITSSLSTQLEIPDVLQCCFTDEKLTQIYNHDAPPSLTIPNTSKFPLYIVSTSGSTGEKKWVPIGGEGLLHWDEVIKHLFQFSKQDKILATRSPAYDARTFEYMMAFSSGITLHLINRTERKDLEAILATCSKHQITCLVLIASQFGSKDIKPTLSELKTYGLKYLIVTGDVCTPYLKKCCEELEIHLFNGYGPSEATIGGSLLCVNNLPCSKFDSGEEIVPIAYPYGSEVRYHLLKTLHIESPYLTPGYIGTQHDHPAFKFISDKQGNLIRLFDTGDICYEQNGYIFYQGRYNPQGHCKVDGVKINPLSIESRIQAFNHYPIDVAVVIKQYLGKNTPFAYIATNTKIDETFLASLRTHIKKELHPAEYPVLLTVEALPRNNLSQKIDRQALIARSDDFDSHLFNESKRLSAKFSNDGQGTDPSRLATITAKLANERELNQLSLEAFGAVINEAVLCANHIDQQHNISDIAQKEQHVLILLKTAYFKFIARYPNFDFLSFPSVNIDESFFILSPHVFSIGAQLLHYFGKALRYEGLDTNLLNRVAMFKAAIKIATFLETAVLEEDRQTLDPNYFPGRLLTYHLQIIYTLKQLEQFEEAIEHAQKHLLIAHKNHDTFHIIQGLVQLSESYLAAGQHQAAFERANEVYELVNQSAKRDILFFNALTIYMKCANLKKYKTLASTLAKSVIALENIPGAAVKPHHITAAKDVLGLQDINYLLAVKTIWVKLLAIDTIPIDVDFRFLGGDSSLLRIMISELKIIDSTYSMQILLSSMMEITVTNIANSLVENYIHHQEQAWQNQAFIHALVVSPTRKGNIFILPALLPEGYFSLLNLAKRIAEKFNKNIYGLTNPGIFDDKLVPTSIEHAVSRYAKAIQSVQKEGPYELWGFSFGAFLAIKLVDFFESQGEKVSEVHLLDGLPPLLFQKLSNADFANLLQSLLNFIVETLRNRYYAEAIKPIKLTKFERLDKEKQLEKGLEFLKEKVLKLESKNLITLAKLHLMFLLEEPYPLNKSHSWATLYLTDTQQPYLQVINQLPHLSNESADYHYFLWNRYFSNMTRCGLELEESDHLGVLKAGPSKEKRTADYYWRRAHDPLLNLKFDIFGPHARYLFKKTDNTQTQLTIFFVWEPLIQSVINQLQCLGLSPSIASHDKRIQKYEQRDTIYTSQATIFCMIPAGLVRQSTELVGKMGINPSATSHKGYPRRFFQPSTNKLLFKPEMQMSGCLDLIIILNGCETLTLSFKYNAVPPELVDNLQRTLNILPCQFSGKNGHLLYQQKVIMEEGSTFEAIRTATLFLEDFISILQVYISDLTSQTKMVPNINYVN